MNRLLRIPCLLLLPLLLWTLSHQHAGAQQSESRKSESLRVLFLGDNGHHQPARRASELLPALEKRGIFGVYSDDVDQTLSLDRLKQFDALILYANIDTITDPQAEALLQYVAEGGGFVPLHCASYCFRNNAEVVALIGGQFLRHGTGEFVVYPTEEGKKHPILEGYRSFQSWDETYVHTLHNEENRTVLQYRTEGDQREPWTWIRTHGEGRVFYTAWGHDQRTFNNPGFQNLVERGIRWVTNRDPRQAGTFEGPDLEPLAQAKMTSLPEGDKPFEYIDVGPKIPNYIESTKWGEQEKPRTLMQKPLAPEASMQRYVTPQGFHLDLYAAEPKIGGKPICMAWDASGRLWVAETYDYPNELQPEGAGRDSIRICEDTDGDGKADKFTRFAENLSIPTSLTPAFGGVIVHQAPHTLFLKDTDGDDVADVREILFTGWNTNDTHAGPSNLRYGHDNWFYGMVGYAGFEGEIAGERRSFRTGFYRFKVDQVDGRVAVTDFEFLRNTDNNSWGVGLSEEGLLFGSTANRNPSEFMPIANRHYERVRGWTSKVLHGIADTHRFDPITENVRQVDHHGGYTAAAGHALYTARNYPSEYWNRTAFVAGPTGHLVGTFVLKRDGAGYKSTSPLNLVASDDEWAAPIMAEVGPDGNVWVIDWYNYIVQHNPTPIGFETGPGNAYLTDLRDKTHGRIYRVVPDYPQSAQSLIQSLDNRSPSEWVAALKSDNMFWRLHAQRLLVERGDTDVASELVELAQGRTLDSLGLDVGALHALRTLDGLGMFGEDISSTYRELLNESLSHPSAAVVRTAVELMPRDAAGRDALLDANLASADDAQVQLSTLLALAEMPASERAADAALTTLNAAVHQSDVWMLDAATTAAASHAASFLQAACQATSVSKALPERAAIVAEHMARSKDFKEIEQVVSALADASTEISSAVIEGWTRGWPRDAEIVLSEKADQQLLALFDNVPAGSKGQLIRLGKQWGSEKLAANAARIADSLLEIAEDEEANEQQRVEAARELVGLMEDDLEVAESLMEIISARTPPSIATGFIQSLQRSRAEGVGELLIEEMARFTPAVRPAAIRVLLARPETTRTLLESMTEGEVSSSDLELDQKQALLNHPSREIRETAKAIFARSGGLPSPDRQKVLTSLMKTTEMKGDVTRGKAVYKKNCANCHTHRGEGTKVGPDLTGMAVHPKAELLTHIVDPNRSVEGNYRSYAVLTVDGVVINGLLASETQTAIEIYDAQGKKHVVLREDIERFVAMDQSVMPEGFEKQIDEQGFADLLEFLTSKGKYLPLPLDKVATAVSTKGLFHEGDNGPDRLLFDDWSLKMIGDVPFQLIDPQGKQIPNIVLLNGPRGTLPPQMPKAVRVLCNSPASKLHLLSGISGWGFPAHQEKSVSMIVRLHLDDGSTEDHPLLNGVHFADYIRRVDVPQSEFAMMLGGQQIRHLTVEPKTDKVIREVELVKGNDPTAPIVVAMTLETGEAQSDGH